jgi:hypothetical protein
VNALAGLHRQLAVGGLHHQRPAQYDREFVELRALTWLSPARRAAHVSDAQAGLPGAGPPHVLVDQLRRLTSGGHPARLADQFRHACQYSAAWPRIDDAIAGYQVFSALRAEGVISAPLRFQVGLPFPSSALNGFKANFAADYPVAERAFEDLVARELRRRTCLPVSPARN